MHCRSFAAIALLATVLPIHGAVAGDWPQIMGPHRNGITNNERLAEQWPKSGPPKLWEAKIGSGFAGVAVSGDKVVLFHREGDDDKLTAFNRETGERVWTAKFPSTFQPQIVEDDGPRAVPTIQGDAVYAYSAQGKLYCVELQSGTERWQRNTHQDFRADGGYFGAGSAPVVEGSLVIVNVGGDKMKAGIVAFDTATGKTVWSAGNDQASYAAPIVTTISETRHLLCVTRLNFVSLDPLTGKEHFRTPFGQRGPTVNAAIPVVMGNHALLTASYGIGAEWLELGVDKVNVAWEDTLLSSQYTTPIIHDGAVYGIDGRQDSGAPSTLKCFDPETKKVHWSKPGLKYSTLIAAGPVLLMMQTDGVLKMARLTTDGYEQLGSASLLTGTTRALPALADGRFYVRNEKNLICVDLAAH
ncbi:PQQ-binding-like beta-propeller repeat protein [Schlesneria paludicola]|uniref:PQQ-binding-like beta-propeller repeat protein n=1 Tax=Schlesneria paludicola TaxID=360056 RepID=UPI000299F6A5|nr:PQQ-binding-like beta-propeller repeat protein [Schlesneria paludicola]